MVIHHDKLAYGKLSDLSMEFSDEELLKMVAELNAQTEESDQSGGEDATEERSEPSAELEKGKPKKK